MPCCRAAAAQAPTKAEATFDGFVDYIHTLQHKILSTAEELEGGKRKFVVDRWERDAGNPNAGTVQCPSACPWVAAGVVGFRAAAGLGTVVKAHTLAMGGGRRAPAQH